MEHIKARNTCISMLEQREYTNINATEEMITAVDSNGENVHVYFSNEAKLNMINIKNLFAESISNGVKHIILIYKQNITTQARKSIETMHDIDIELFVYDEMQFNITKHRLVPKHERVTSPDIILEIKNKFGLSKLPGLLEIDPICRFYNFKRGHVIKVTRLNSIIYRVVR